MLSAVREMAGLSKVSDLQREGRDLAAMPLMRDQDAPPTQDPHTDY